MHFDKNSLFRVVFLRKAQKSCIDNRIFSIENLVFDTCPSGKRAFSVGKKLELMADFH